MNYSINDIKKIIRHNLSDEKYEHSIGVMSSAKQLAQKYGANVEKAELTGLLHDITKEYSKEQHRNVIEKYNINLDELEKTEKKLWHSITGSYLVKNEIIDDDEIFNAVRYHTTGRADMSLLEKIIYVADFIEPNRDYDDVEYYRKKAFENLDTAFFEGVKWNLIEILQKNKIAHINTLNAYNFMIKDRKKGEN